MKQNDDCDGNNDNDIAELSNANNSDDFDHYEPDYQERQ